MQLSIPINMLPDGSFVPALEGQGQATVTVNQEPGQNKTAIINFAGCNQAVVNFNSDSQPINYTIFNTMASMAIQQSISHIINHLVANRLI